MIQKLLSFRLVLVLSLLVFILQPYKVGFEKGHHGWVSSHVLAQVSNAKPSNLFLGYAHKYKTSDARVDFAYFDRYPVIFSGLTHLFLRPFWNDLAHYVYMARQWMNLIYVLSVLLIFRITYLITGSRLRGAVATLFVASSSLLMKYKDMVHFDQPALLGCLLALNGIWDYEMKGRKRYLLLGCLLGPLLGRGYAVIFFLAAWVLVKFGYTFYKDRKLATSFKIAPLLYLALSVPLPAGMLALNIIGESRIRNVPIEETSIVVSAMHRLGFVNYKAEPGTAKKVSLPSFINNQFQRGLDLLTPYPIYTIHIKNYKKAFQHYLSLLPKLLYQIFILVLFFKFFRQYWNRLERNQRSFQLTLIAGGVLWLVVMRNLAHYHEYVTMYLVGALIVCWLFLVDLMLLRWREEKVLELGLAIFFVSLFIHWGSGAWTAKQVNWQPQVFSLVREEMEKRNVSTAYFGPFRQHFIDGVPYAESFFLRGFNLTYQPELADLIVKRSGAKSLHLLFQDKEHH